MENGLPLLNMMISSCLSSLVSVNAATARSVWQISVLKGNHLILALMLLGYTCFVCVCLSHTIIHPLIQFHRQFDETRCW